MVPDRDLLQALVEDSAVCCYAFDSGGFIYANARLCEMVGRSAEEVLRLHPLDLLADEDRAAAQVHIDARLRPQQIEAGHAREVEVQQCEVETLVVEYRERDLDVGSMFNLPPLFFKEAAHQPENWLDDQD